MNESDLNLELPTDPLSVFHYDTIMAKLRIIQWNQSFPHLIEYEPIRAKLRTNLSVFFLDLEVDSARAEIRGQKRETTRTDRTRIVLLLFQISTESILIFIL